MLKSVIKKENVSACHLMRMWIRLFCHGLNMHDRKKVPISWNVLKEKSLEFANELGESSFVASNGWLQRFNSRHNLSFKKLCEEAADFDCSSLKEWKDVVLRDILERYESANVDECGLFFIGSCQTELFVSKVKNG
ncbi:hypothetical protein AVEN_148403-1 [Araneus ventricosus]|uniref:HTH CENPB-type domain-containing protein n=1 Tax=Araneus ventricosus TaxID=182803 RepID=A0A4Y2NKZ2_ARAVE|nr:hypothetical protein AVEN_148403-1 [Araneus ventricosus]